MCMFLCKGKMLFFHSLINKRLFGCFMTRKIQIFLKGMLDCFYLLQQLWVEMTRVFLDFLFHDGVSQSRCLSSPSSTKFMLGNSVIRKLSGCCQEPHDGCFLSSTLLTYDFYWHLFLPPCKNTSFFFITSILSKLQIFKTLLHKLLLFILFDFKSAMIFACLTMHSHHYYSHKNPETDLFLYNNALSMH